MADDKSSPETQKGDVNDEEMDDEEVKSSTLAGSVLTSEMMKNPEVLAALQSRLGSMMEHPSGIMENLPKPIKRRIKALKKLQLECTKIEAKFYEEIHQLECKYASLYAPYYEKRQQIVNAKHEPTDEECDFPSDTEKDDELAEDLKNKASVEDKDNESNTKKESDTGDEIKGIPKFWLTTLQNVDMLAEMIQEHDEPILKHLVDIKVKYSLSDPMGFTLEFYFEPNDYFSNTVLTKEYEMKCQPDETDPFSFEGPEIYKCKGCTIDWKKGKNVTVKTIKKKQKHKARGSIRTISKTVQNDSFFNFFNPPSVSDLDQMDDVAQALLAADFEIGQYIREHIVPRAVLYYTGEALADDEYDEDGEEDEDEDEEGDDHDEDEEDENEDRPLEAPKSMKQQKHQLQQQEPPECKQQ